jgi:type IV secretory pathway VirB10-like protein
MHDQTDLEQAESLVLAALEKIRISASLHTAALLDLAGELRCQIREAIWDEKHEA